MAKFKPQKRRLIFIDRMIRSGKFPNCRSLAEEWETSGKTIQRDIDFLREIGAPIEYDAQKYGYYYSEPTYSLPAVDVSEGDLFAICIAEKALKQYEDTPIYDKLRTIFQKIEQSLPEKVSVYPSWVDTQVTFFQNQRRKIVPETWETISDALRSHKTLKILHQVPTQDRPVEREVDPYHLVSYQGEWYLVGLCHAKEEIRTFAISRIKEAGVLERHFDLPADLDLKTLINTSFGIIWSDQEYKVRVRFTPAQAPYVVEREWHPTQEVRKNRDGSVILSFTTSDLYEVKRWVLSWGADAKVLGPKALVVAVREEAAGLNVIYT